MWEQQSICPTSSLKLVANVYPPAYDRIDYYSLLNLHEPSIITTSSTLWRPTQDNTNPLLSHWQPIQDNTNSLLWHEQKTGGPLRSGRKYRSISYTCLSQHHGPFTSKLMERIFQRSHKVSRGSNSVDGDPIKPLVSLLVGSAAGRSSYDGLRQQYTQSVSGGPMIVHRERVM